MGCVRMMRYMRLVHSIAASQRLNVVVLVVLGRSCLAKFSWIVPSSSIGITHRGLCVFFIQNVC